MNDNINYTTDKKNSDSIIKKFFSVSHYTIDYKFLNLILKVGFILIVLLLLQHFFSNVGYLLLFGTINLLSILAPFIFAIIISVLIFPLTVKRTSVYHGTKILMPTTYSVVFLGLLSIILITSITVGSIYLIGNSMTGFMQSYTVDSNNKDYLKDFIYNLLNNINIGENIRLFTESGTFNLNGIWKQYSSNISFITSYFLFSVSIFFILPNVGKFGVLVEKIIPRIARNSTLPIVNIMSNSFGNYIRGQVKIATIVASLSGIVILIGAVISNTVFDLYNTNFILSFKNPFTFIVILLFVLICGATNLIPMIGPFIGGAVVSILVLFSELNFVSEGELPWITIIIVVGIIILQQLESMFLQPRIMGKIGKVNGFLILVSLTIGGSLFGIVGMIISTPILYSIKSLLEYFDNKYKIFLD